MRERVRGRVGGVYEQGGMEMVKGRGKDVLREGKGRVIRTVRGRYSHA